jgi:hypothetical protein
MDPALVLHVLLVHANHLRLRLLRVVHLLVLVLVLKRLMSLLLLGVLRRGVIVLLLSLPWHHLHRHGSHTLTLLLHRNTTTAAATWVKVCIGVHVRHSRVTRAEGWLRLLWLLGMTHLLLLLLMCHSRNNIVLVHRVRRWLWLLLRLLLRGVFGIRMAGRRNIGSRILLLLVAFLIRC